MNIKEILNEYRFYDTELEWLEYKVNWFQPDELGEYISALSNSAALAGKKFAHLIWGIHDITHEIVGTDFKYNIDVKGEPLKHYLSRQFTPDINFLFDEDIIEGKRVVVLQIPAAKTVFP